MGRRSIKEDKNIYQLKRDACGLSRDDAAAKLPGVSKDRLYRIENGPNPPHPDEVIVMAKAYGSPELCNHYCANQCAIGRESVAEVEIEDLPSIVLKTLSSLNALDKQKDRFIEIAADSKVDETEIKDFRDIQDVLKKISMAVDSLSLWAKQMEAAEKTKK